MAQPLHIALIGCGTVGTGVAKLLLEHPERLAARAGRRLILKRIVVNDLKKPRPEWIPRPALDWPAINSRQHLTTPSTEPHRGVSLLPTHDLRTLQAA